MERSPPKEIWPSLEIFKQTRLRFSIKNNLKYALSVVFSIYTVALIANYFIPTFSINIFFITIQFIKVTQEFF